MIALRRRVRRGWADDLLLPEGGAAISSMDRLRSLGFSDRFMQRFFRPFLGGVLLDRDLGASARSLEYFFRMFSEGRAVLPARGMGAIPQQLKSRLVPNTVRTQSRVISVESGLVVLDTGERIVASAVVVATEADAAAKLVPCLSVPRSNPATCLYFDAPSPPPGVGPFLVLDGDGEGPVNELAVPSEVSPSYAPPGRALVSASVLGTPTSDNDALESAARKQLTGWFGDAVSQWRLLQINRIPHALPYQPPGPHAPVPRSTVVGPGLFVCGDHRHLASLQGAMASGRRAAADVTAAFFTPRLTV